MKFKAASTIAAFLVAPAVPALMAVKVPWLAAMIYCLAAASEIALGVPAFLLGRWLGLIRWWSAILVGAIMGIASMLYWQGGLLMYPSLPQNEAEQSLIGAYAVPGALSGLVFWLVWITGHRQKAA